MNESVKNRIFILTKKWKFRQMVAAILWSFGMFCMSSGILLWTSFFSGLWPILIISIIIGLCTAFLYLKRVKWFSFTDKNIIQKFHLAFPALEYSLDLFWKDPDKITPVSALQKERIRHSFLKTESAFKLDQPIYHSLIPFVLGTFILVTIGLNPADNNELQLVTRQVTSDSGSTATEKESAKPVRIDRITVKIEPPGYTKINPFLSDSLSFRAPSGSLVTWTVRSQAKIYDAEFWLNDRDQIPHQFLDSNRIAFQSQIFNRALYRIILKNENSVYESDYYEIQVIPDKKPFVEIQDQRNYTVYPDEKAVLEVKAFCTDDYGIRDAMLIGTISRGKGESVSFRNDTVYYQDVNWGEKEYRLTATLDLKKLEMKPGDELYYHFEAADNRIPENQISRTAKYIVAIADTGRDVTGIDGRLGVNRMPENFRSQRQIIIDTEKLIGEKASLSKEVFQSKSNNIAIDQKLLRLRYGRFLGEEFETTIGLIERKEEPDDHTHHHHEEESEHQDTVSALQSEEQYLQQDSEHTHDTDNFEGIDQMQENLNQEELEEMLEPYAHFHDRAGQATYFDQITISKLKAALSEMWDAEFHLRMGEPEKALPYEFRALSLIKEIQQASRIYVERIGFDPPEINISEHRLRGKLDDINPFSKISNTSEEKWKEEISAIIHLCETWKYSENKSLDSSQVKLLERAGQFLADISLERPGYFLTLQLLRDWVTGDIPPASRHEVVSKIQHSLHNLFDDSLEKDFPANSPDLDLTKKYISKFRKESWN